MMVVVLGGLWLGWQWVGAQRDQAMAAHRGQLPDFEYVDLSPADLAERAGISLQASAPQSWDRISLRLFAEEDGSYVKFMRFLVDADEVEASNPAVFRADLARHRSADEQPPAWWPRGGAQEPWVVPSWWQPQAGRGVWWAVPDSGGHVVGCYLHYDADSRWLHLWEWRRSAALLARPQVAVDALLVDRVATLLGARLAAARHPLSYGDWLHAPERRPDELVDDVEQLPAGVRGADALLRPGRYLMAIHGLDVDQAQQAVAEVAMRSLPSDGPPPATWTFAQPMVDGQAWLPPWFRPGPGPRWAYSVPRPADGRVEAARWAAYDVATQTLYVWDWRALAAPQPAQVDPLH
ncbi:MAG: hypothetical protein ACYTF0_05670 [Planctomycetota bacterium]